MAQKTRKFISKQLADRLRAVIHQRERTRLRAGEMSFDIQSQAVEDRGHNLRRFDWPLHRIAADLIALPNDTSAFYAAARKIDGPALWKMTASTGRVDLGCATEFGEARHQGLVQQAALEKVFDERAVTFVVHRRNDVLHAVNGRERLRTMDIPCDLIEDGDECVDGNETHARFD